VDFYQSSSTFKEDAHMFLLCAEILAIVIKQNKDIKGIHVENTEHKISQYADDTHVLR
jgi:hypothetical protein